MKTEQLIPPLRDLPAGRLAQRKQHLVDEVSRRPGDSWLRSPWRALSLTLGMREKPVVLVKRRQIIAAVALAAAVSALAATATLGGAARQKYDAVPAANVEDVIAQVQQSFGDGIIQSASVDGSTVNINLADAKLDSATVGGFEATILAHAVSDWQGAHGETPVTQLSLVPFSATGTKGQAQVESINSPSAATPLPSGACETAAQSTPSSLTVVSAQQLPYAGGTCVFKVQTSGDPSAAAVAVSDAKSNAIQNASDYPSLIEVDDPSGNPQIVLTWVPSINGAGEGRLFVRPGLSSPLHL